VTPWCTQLLSELDAADARANELAARLTAEEFNWKARPEEWSAGQCLEHLCITNEVYLPPIERALAGQSPAAVDAITPGWFSRWFIRSYIAPSPQTKRARAPGKTTPASNVAPSVVERFLASNREARRIARLAQDLDVNRIRFKNPFVPLLRFTVGTGLEIIAKHEARHLLQAERVRQSMPLLTRR
jgi:DinB superfamily